jgi:hypothetical protein
VLPELEARLALLRARPFDRAAVEVRWKAVASEARAQCARLAPAAARVRMILTFTAPDGVLDDMRFAQEGMRDTPLGECLLRSFARSSAPRFGGRSVSVPITISLGPHTR